MRYFFKNLSSLLLSLLLAILVWVTAVKEQNPSREDDYVHTIPIEVISPAPGLITTDSPPQTVRLRLRAPENSWAALTPSKFKAAADLSKLPAGLNDVPVDVVVSDPAIEIIGQTPQVVTVNIQVEQTITLPLKVEVMDTPPLGYVNRTPIPVPALVTVTGPASLISQIDEAVAEIFIRSAKETVERTGAVFIRDRNDQLIEGLKINPTKVQITLPIEQRFGYKDVSVSAVVQGQVAPGYWVSNISVNPSTLVIVGNPKVLSSIPGFIETTPINVNQATEDIVRIVPLNLPDGVAVVLPGGQTTGASGVQVTVDVAAIESGQTVQRPITQQGIDPGYTWTASPQRADVILSGPIPGLQALEPDDVQVIVDLFGLRPGVYKVHPTVFLPDGLRLEAVLPDTIEITIALVPTPTATLTPTPASTGAASQTNSIRLPSTPTRTMTPPASKTMTPEP